MSFLQLPFYGEIERAQRVLIAGNHATERTCGSRLFINPLMALYWSFRLEAVAERLLYPEDLYLTSTMQEVSNVIRRFREARACRDWRDLPL
jgi:hypothetical protein